VATRLGFSLADPGKSKQIQANPSKSKQIQANPSKSGLFGGMGD
jgi:hypothetical protein